MDKYPPKVIKASLVVYIAYLLLMTLAPFRFRPLQINHFPWPIGPLRTDSFDIIANVFLFLPFGFILAIFPQGKKRLRQGLCVILSAVGLSLAIETLQIVIHGRFSSFLDVFTNVLGGGIGFFLGGHHYFHPTPPLSSHPQRFFRALSLLYAGFLLYLPFAADKPFSGWNPDVQLLIGNNPEQTRPWKGEILSLAVYNQVLTLDQIKKHYQGGPLSFRDNLLQQSPLAFYLIFNGSTFLVSEKKRSKIDEQIRRTNQLTVETWIRPQPQFDSGGRLISFIRGNRTLWYLHQDQDEIVLSVRDSLFKRGYFHSEGIKRLLSSNDPVHIVGIYDPERVSLAVNGREVVEGFLTNGFFVLLNFLNLDRMPWGGRGLLSLALFWPWGFLLSLSLETSSLRTLTARGLWGGCFVSLILLICAQHSVLFFTLRTVWVPLCAEFLGMVSGEGVKRYIAT